MFEHLPDNAGSVRASMGMDAITALGVQEGHGTQDMVSARIRLLRCLAPRVSRPTAVDCFTLFMDGHDMNMSMVSPACSWRTRTCVCRLGVLRHYPWMAIVLISLKMLRGRWPVEAAAEAILRVPGPSTGPS